MGRSSEPRILREATLKASSDVGPEASRALQAAGELAKDERDICTYIYRVYQKIGVKLYAELLLGTSREMLKLRIICVSVHAP